MVKFIGLVNFEFFVVVEVIVEKFFEFVKSCCVFNYEFYLIKFFVIFFVFVMLGMIFLIVNKVVINFSDEEVFVEVFVEGVEKLSIFGEVFGFLVVLMFMYLDNIVMYKCFYVQQVIVDICVEVKYLFCFYLCEYGFKEFEFFCFIVVVFEGGVNVFCLFYFEKEVFFVQLLQFYKQIEVFVGRKCVFCVGFVFRVENSNIFRYMIEFIGFDLEMEVIDYQEVLYMFEGVFFYIFCIIKKICVDEIVFVWLVYFLEEFFLFEEGKEVCLIFVEG